eukprot:1190621-Prorocentrum_minimum.AAC.3
MSVSSPSRGYMLAALRRGPPAADRVDAADGRAIQLTHFCSHISAEGYVLAGLRRGPPAADRADAADGRAIQLPAGGQQGCLPDAARHPRLRLRLRGGGGGAGPPARLLQGACG